VLLPSSHRYHHFCHCHPIINAAATTVAAAITNAPPSSLPLQLLPLTAKAEQGVILIRSPSSSLDRNSNKKQDPSRLIAKLEQLQSLSSCQNFFFEFHWTSKNKREV